MSATFWYNDILYTYLGNNKLRIGTGENTGRYNPNGVRNRENVSENLILPSSVYFRTVAIIGRNAFSSCYTIKTLFIPETIERIEQFSLECLDNLISITVAPGGKAIFEENSLHMINSDFTIYYGGTKCQKENAIAFRPNGVIYTFIVSPAYKCRSFVNLDANDNFTVDYSLKWFGNKPQTCKTRRTSINHVFFCLLLIDKKRTA